MNIMEALKSMILSIFQSEWQEEQKKVEAEAEERRQSVVNAEVAFQQTFRELYELLFEAGLYQGMRIRDGYTCNGYEVIIGSEEKTFVMRYDKGRIQPNDHSQFDVWPLNRLIKEVQDRLDIIPSQELQVEREKFIQPAEV